MVRRVLEEHEPLHEVVGRAAAHLGARTEDQAGQAPPQEPLQVDGGRVDAEGRVAQAGRHVVMAREHPHPEGTLVYRVDAPERRISRVGVTAGGRPLHEGGERRRDQRASPGPHGRAAAA